ncbi:MAG: hypothetical protein S4CHLAM7_13230 [Chlamydiae bacterium]|nr:hypothetical protein [Chlamydiota bacterium]
MKLISTENNLSASIGLKNQQINSKNPCEQKENKYSVSLICVSDLLTAMTINYFKAENSQSILSTYISPIVANAAGTLVTNIFLRFCFEQFRGENRLPVPDIINRTSKVFVMYSQLKLSLMAAHYTSDYLITMTSTSQTFYSLAPGAICSLIYLHLGMLSAAFAALDVIHEKTGFFNYIHDKIDYITGTTVSALGAQESST